MSQPLAKLPRRFGAAVRAERIARKMSQERLARSADISPTYVGEVERGEKIASLEIVVRLARAMRLTGADLLRKAGI